MKRLMFLLMLIPAISLYSYSHDNKNFHDLRISFNGTGSFGIKYRFGNDNLLFRLSLLSINGNMSSSNNFNLSFEIVPALNYGYGKNSITTNRSLTFSGTTSGANITVAYRF